MKVTRKIKMDVAKYEIGDQIKIKINGEKHTATAIRRDDDGMLFLLDQCLDIRLEMYRNITADELSYENSDVRKFLRDCTASKKLIPNIDGDRLWILSKNEVFGNNQIEWLKDPVHRCASCKEDGGQHCATWWLRDVVLSMYFALVSGGGNAYNSCASPSLGVRPAFKINDL